MLSKLLNTKHEALNTKLLHAEHARFPYSIISLENFFIEQVISCSVYEAFVLRNILKLIMDALGIHAEEGRI